MFVFFTKNNSLKQIWSWKLHFHIDMASKELMNSVIHEYSYKIIYVLKQAESELQRLQIDEDKITTGKYM